MRRSSAPTDPRETIRADLVAAGGRRAASRRRRRSLAIATVAITGLLGAAAGTAAISGHGTGVPVLDDALSISVERSGGPGRRPPNARTWVDLRPGPGGASLPLTLPPARAGQAGSGIGVAYVDRNRFICFVRVGADRRPDRGGVGCTARKLVWRALEERPAFVTGGGGYDVPGVSAVAGFARADVESVRIDGSRGPVEATVGAPWTPKLPGARTLRPFVAIVPYDTTARGIPDVIGKGLTVTLANGKVVELER